jgi:hypothetical protein
MTRKPRATIDARSRGHHTRTPERAFVPMKRGAVRSPNRGAAQLPGVHLFFNAVPPVALTVEKGGSSRSGLARAHVGGSDDYSAREDKRNRNPSRQLPMFCYAHRRLARTRGIYIRGLPRPRLISSNSDSGLDVADGNTLSTLRSSSAAVEL